MQIKVMLFGQLKDLLNQEYILIADVNDSETLLQRLTGLYPVLFDTTFRLAVDNKIVSENTKIDSASSVALLPPFSGG